MSFIDYNANKIRVSDQNMNMKQAVGLAAFISWYSRRVVFNISSCEKPPTFQVLERTLLNGGGGCVPLASNLEMYCIFNAGESVCVCSEEL